MEIWHFFVIFHDFVMKCVYKSTIYTFVIRDKIWTPPLCFTKVYMLLLCFGSRKHPPTPYMSGTFVLVPPPPILLKFGSILGSIWLGRELLELAGELLRILP